MNSYSYEFSNQRTINQNTFLKSQDMALVNVILCSILTQIYRTSSSQPSSPVHTFKDFGTVLWFRVTFVEFITYSSASLPNILCSGWCLFSEVFAPPQVCFCDYSYITSLQCLTKALSPSVRSLSSYLVFLHSYHSPNLASPGGSHPPLQLSCTSGLAASPLKQEPHESCS